MSFTDDGRDVVGAVVFSMVGVPSILFDGGDEGAAPVSKEGACVGSAIVVCFEVGKRLG